MTHELFKKAGDLLKEIANVKALIHNASVPDGYYLNSRSGITHSYSSKRNPNVTPTEIKIPVPLELSKKIHEDHLYQLRARLYIAEQQFKAL